MDRCCWQDETQTRSSIAVSSVQKAKERAYCTELHCDEVHVEGETIWNINRNLEHLNADPLLSLLRVCRVSATCTCDTRRLGDVSICERVHEQIDANRWWRRQLLHMVHAPAKIRVELRVIGEMALVIFQEQVVNRALRMTSRELVETLDAGWLHVDSLSAKAPWQVSKPSERVMCTRFWLSMRCTDDLFSCKRRQWTASHTTTVN